jgi:hypothetical protein
MELVTLVFSIVQYGEPVGEALWSILGGIGEELGSMMLSGFFHFHHQPTCFYAGVLKVISQ